MDPITLEILKYGALGFAYLITVAALAFSWRVFSASQKQNESIVNSLVQSATAQNAMAQALLALVKEVDGLSDLQRDQRFDLRTVVEAIFRELRKDLREWMKDVSDQ